ncbi:MAG TPA: hypothetical protein VIK64_06930 [Anaerolineales bacterium]
MTVILMTVLGGLLSAQAAVLGGVLRPKRSDDCQPSLQKCKVDCEILDFRT